MPNSSKGTAIIAITVANQFYLLFVYNYNHHILFYNLYTLSLIAGVKMNKVLSEYIFKKIDGMNHINVRYISLTNIPK